MKYILIFLSSFIVFVANADPLPKDVNVVNTPEVDIRTMPQVEVTVPNALDVNVQNTLKNCHSFKLLGITDFAA